MKLARISVVAAAFAFGAVSIARADDPKPIRHLVYNFGVSLATTRTEHTSGIGGDGPASGSVDSHASNSDTGTIVADVIAVQPDTGLVVRISEQGRGERNNAPTMCVTYGATGAVLCDQTHGMPNEEEYALLRVLGKDFVNAAMLDAKHHWTTSSQASGGSETNDYTIDSSSGDVDNISFQRVLDVQGVGAYKATSNGHIVYNVKSNVPVSMTEDTTTRKNTGMGNYDTIDQKMTFSLASDSLAQGH